MPINFSSIPINLCTRILGAERLKVAAAYSPFQTRPVRVS